MKPCRSLCESKAIKVPKASWLASASAALAVALPLFRMSRKLGRPGVLAWLAVQMLDVAGRCLGHAPAECRIEFRADLPVEI